jgi:hypothetical protein
MADVVKCLRCGEPISRPRPLGHGLRGVSVCPVCNMLVVSEQGEIPGPEDKADPESWGGLGWA